MRETIFWVIFSTVAVALLFTQVLSTSISKPSIQPPEEIKQMLPDVSKLDKNASLVYENYVLTKRLEQLSNEKKIIYGLGDYTGPQFSISVVKEGAKQNALQEIMDLLEQTKLNIKAKITKEQSDKYSQTIDDIFAAIYQQLSSSEGTLVNTYKIWQKNNGELMTYYMLILFDDEYAMILVQNLFFDTLTTMKADGLDFESLWTSAFTEPLQKQDIQK